MIKTYLRIAWRHLLKNKGYTFINIAGLAIGMAIALLIGLWITEEFSFEHYHTNYRRIAQNLTVRHTPDGAGVWYSSAVPLEQELRARYRDLFEKTTLVFGGDEHLVSVGDKKLSAAGLWAEKEFPEIFTFKMLSGSMTSMADPSTALISVSLAKSLFGVTDPVGKTFRYENKLDLTIGGVFEDLPMNTSYYGTKMVLPWGNKENSYHNTNTNWDDHNAQLYVLLADKVTAEQATARIKNLPTPHIKGWLEDVMLYPLDKFRLYGDFKDGRPVAGGIRYVWMFGLIGVFVLLLACINFMNLSTARSASRAKEVGIRKTAGSMKSQLVAQFLSESVLMALLSFALSLGLVETALPFFNSLSAKDMALPWNQWLFWLLAIGFIFLTGFLAGSYPAFYLSGFNPVKVLKGTFRAGPSAGLARQVLVVIQFTVSLTLIIGTIVVYRQIQFTKDRPVGYKQDRLVSVDINTPELRAHYPALRTELLQRRLVEDIAGSSMKVTDFEYRNEVDWRGKRPDQAAVLFTNVNVTTEFGKTIGWQVIQGRDFDRAYPTDSTAMVINEAAAAVIGFKNPVGETLRYDNRNWTVIGVVKNMVVNSPYDRVDPAIFLGDGWGTSITMRLPAGKPAHAALEAIAPVFAKYNPGSPFLYQFMDQEYNKKFVDETRIGNLAGVFTALAIFISCLGLFGLASFVAEQRTKEIGVRKVLGAKVFALWSLQSKGFVKLVVLSFLLAMPLAYLIMSKWLQNYAYHTAVSWWIFALAGGGILLITLLTVSYQSLKAATMNPVKSLRSE